MSWYKKNTLHVLIDMDGVLCDFEGQTLKMFRKTFPAEPYIEPEDRRTFYMWDQYEVLKKGSRVNMYIHCTFFIRLTCFITNKIWSSH